MTERANDSRPVFGVWAETGAFESAVDRASLVGTLITEGVAVTLSAEALDNAAGGQSFSIAGGDGFARDLRRSGWAVLYGRSVSDAIKAALQPLIAHRKGQVADDDLFAEFDDYTPGQTAEAWLKADPRKATMQVVDPEYNKDPYYILIVAAPDDVPFEFQFDLDLFWAVGRLWFQTAEEFARYAQSVIAYETADTVTTRKELVLFGPRRDEDQASVGLDANVFTPWTQRELGRNQKFTQRALLGDAATKVRLLSLLKGDEGTPALLFTGSHGLMLTPSSVSLAERMGALVCQEWPGTVPVKPQHVVAASDVPADAQVHGMIHVMFCCFGGGWPATSTYKRDENGNALPLAPTPMMARLPQTLLGRANGALAVLAHVDLLHGWSYTANHVPQNQSLTDVLLRLMDGQPIGHATDQLNLRWAGETTRLLEALESQKRWGGEAVAKERATEIEKLWVARHDARGYVVLGDPAVRLRVDNMPPVTA